MSEEELVEKYREIKDFADGVKSPFFARLEQYVLEQNSIIFKQVTNGETKEDEHDLLMRVRSFNRLIDYSKRLALGLPQIQEKLDAAGIEYEKDV